MDVNLEQGHTSSHRQLHLCLLFAAFQVSKLITEYCLQHFLRLLKFFKLIFVLKLLNLLTELINLYEISNDSLQI